jgi:UDP-glucose 4-epimerase
VLSGANILITGGAGFIGASLAKVLAVENQVTLLDNMHRDALGYVFGSEGKIPDLIKCDVTDLNAVRQAVLDIGPTHIVHSAGVAGIATVGLEPVRTLEVNMIGTTNILAASRELTKLERVVTLSTSEIFGSSALQPTELSPAVIGPVGEPRWVYAVSKLAAEHMAFAYHKQFGMPTVTLRPFNVYGPGQVGEGAMSMFIQQAITNGTIKLHGDGSQIRSWCYIDDMIQGILAALTQPDAIGKAFNIGNPRATLTMFGLANEIKRLTQSQCEIEYVDYTGADIALRIPDIRYTAQNIGFQPLVDLEKGILLTADAYRKR